MCKVVRADIALNAQPDDKPRALAVIVKPGQTAIDKIN